MRYFRNIIIVFFALTMLTPAVSQAEEFLIGCRNFEYINDNGRPIIRAICPESRLEGAPEVEKTADLTGKIGVGSDGYLALWNAERFPDSCEDIHLLFIRKHLHIGATCELAEHTYPFTRYSSLQIDAILDHIFYGWR